jgi:hypothetical protein
MSRETADRDLQHASQATEVAAKAVEESLAVLESNILRLRSLVDPNDKETNLASIATVSLFDTREMLDKARSSFARPGYFDR